MNHAKLQPKTPGLRHMLNHCSLICYHLLVETVTNRAVCPLSQRRLYPVLTAGDEGEYQHFLWLSWCAGPCSRVLRTPVFSLTPKQKLFLMPPDNNELA